MHRFIILLVLLLARCHGCEENSGGQSPLPHQEPISKKLVPKENNQPKEGSLILQESKDLAADLHKSDTLASRYQPIKNKFSAEAGSNTHPTFVGIEGIRRSLRKRATAGEGDLEKFIAWAKTNDWKQFGPSYHHYDWWMFPLNRDSTGQGWKFTVYQRDIQDLKSDPSFLKDYRLGAILLMQSWGWDVKSYSPYTHPAPGQQWRNWDVRLGKLGNSLILFEQWDLYESLKAYVDYLSNNNIQLPAWVKNYFAD